MNFTFGHESAHFAHSFFMKSGLSQAQQ